MSWSRLEVLTSLGLDGTGACGAVPAQLSYAYGQGTLNGLPVSCGAWRLRCPMPWTSEHGHDPTHTVGTPPHAGSPFTSLPLPPCRRR